MLEESLSDLACSESLGSYCYPIVKFRGGEGAVSRSGRFRKRQPMLDTDGTAAAKPGGSPLKGRRGLALTATSAAMVLAAGVGVVAFD